MPRDRAHAAGLGSEAVEPDDDREAALRLRDRDLPLAALIGLSRVVDERAELLRSFVRRVEERRVAPSDRQLVEAIEYVSPGIELHNFKFWFAPPTSQELICSGGISAFWNILSLGLLSVMGFPH